MNKIITFMPNDLKTTIPAFFNEELKNAYKNDEITYITFMYSDLAEQCINTTEFINKYREFMVEWDLPYTYFPYYSYFNKLLVDYIARPNPKLEICIKHTKYVNLICAFAYGFLMLDVKKLKAINFMFNESYPIMYYLQDLAQVCYDNKLWISNCAFIDRHDSWKDLKIFTIDGVRLPTEEFNKETQEYNKIQRQYTDINTFVEIFKRTYCQ